MKLINGWNALLFLSTHLFLTNSAEAQGLPNPGSNPSPTYIQLSAWSFNDTNNWTTDSGHPPISFTNLAVSPIGNGSALLLDSTNAAWLNYNIYETDGKTNLTFGQGAVTFWFAPSWASQSSGGNGIGDWGRLFEIGSYTSGSTYGWWSLYLDDAGNNLYFSTQTNDASGTLTTYLTSPISWVTNDWHFIALTYTSTNSSLYLDGAFVTNGPAITVIPGMDVLTNGFFIGSDSNGMSQAHGIFDDIRTYSTPLDAGTIWETYVLYYVIYLLNPMNQANIASAAPFDASYAQATSTNTPNVITGQGNLQLLGSSANCTTSTNVYLTNMSYTLTASNSGSFTFTIAGGSSGVFYDVFAATVLNSTNGQWSWMGQGNSCNIYSLTNLPTGNVFLILGFPLDTDGDGLTDAYEKLVSHSNPLVADPSGSGMPQGWQVLLGLDPNSDQSTQPGTRINYGYDFSDWLKQVSGIKAGAVTPDNEGNVTSVSQ